MLQALDYAPLTARQVEKISMTWETPFNATRLVRERLQRLSEAKLVTTHRYAILDRGQPENYYLLSRRGYQLLHGPDSQPPTKGYFSPAGLGRQPHQRAISDFVVHTACGAIDPASVSQVSTGRTRSASRPTGSHSIRMLRSHS